VTAIDAYRCYFAKVICGNFVVEKSIKKNADFARVPKTGVTYGGFWANFELCQHAVLSDLWYEIFWFQEFMFATQSAIRRAI